MSARTGHAELGLKAPSCLQHDRQEKTILPSCYSDDVSSRTTTVPFLSSGGPGSFCSRPWCQVTSPNQRSPVCCVPQHRKFVELEAAFS